MHCEGTLEEMVWKGAIVEIKTLNCAILWHFVAIYLKKVRHWFLKFLYKKGVKLQLLRNVNYITLLCTLFITFCCQILLVFTTYRCVDTFFIFTKR